MKSEVFQIIKKELIKYFSNKRLLFSTIILPGLIIYLTYSFIGVNISKQFSNDEIYNIYVKDMPNTVEKIFDKEQIRYKKIKDIELDKKNIISDKVDALVIFPKNFDIIIEDNKNEIPNVKIFYDSSSRKSFKIFNKIVSVLNLYEESISNKFDINKGQEIYDLAKKEEKSGQFYSQFLPVILIIILFTGCMTIVPDSITGEKERGTLTMLLVAPIKRESIVLGKIIGISILSLLSALSTGVGFLFSMTVALQGSRNLNYKLIHYACLLLIIISVVILFVTTISFLSAFAKTAKETQGYVTPLMIIVSLLGITSISSQIYDIYYIYFIPIYNSVQSFSAILSFKINYLNIAITLISNLFYSILLIKAVAKLFKSEKYVF